MHPGVAGAFRKASQREAISAPIVEGEDGLAKVTARSPILFGD